MAYTTIDDPSKYFQIALWTGDNADTRNITNDGNSDLQPDWVWIKSRSNDGNGFDHTVWDTSRGVSNSINTSLSTSKTDPEGLGENVTTTAQLGGVSAMLSDGFTVKEGSSADDARYVNENTRTYVGWQWKANGGSRTTFTESGNNPGGGYQANTTAGFSIVDYTGTGSAGTVSHGLGATPAVIIVKSRTGAADSDGDWNVFHHKNTSAPATDFLILNEATATTDADNRWNDTAPTSSVFTVGTTTRVNNDAHNYIAYCFTEIQGYSKFGSYTGNGNDDGPFVYTGFKPAWIMVKNTGGSENWALHDTKRSPANGNKAELFPNIDSTESVGNVRFDLLSNGFKVRQGSATAINDNGDSIMYFAFAEHPFVSSKGVPATAR